MDKKALITGVTGQDGYYLSKLLLEKGYQVHGIKRRSSLINTQRIDGLYEEMQEKKSSFFLHYGDTTDALSFIRLLYDIQPNEVYNLAAQSHVRVSFDMPQYTADANATGALGLLEAIRCAKMTSRVKFYQASSSEMFGKVLEIPQKETTPFYPRSPYAAAKAFAYHVTVNYRESYDMFASNGILFNHESPMRGETFVTRKIARAVAAIKNGIQDTLYLGNIDAKRDWGHAKDYVYAMWLMLQHHKPDDFVIATGRTETVRYFVEQAFLCVGIKVKWEGEGVNERGFDKKTGKEIIAIDERYFRPTEVDLLLGDSSKAQRDLKWQLSIKLEQLIEEMVEYEMNLIKSKNK